MARITGTKNVTSNIVFDTNTATFVGNKNVGSIINPSGNPQPVIDQTLFSTTEQRKLASAYFAGGVGIEQDLSVGGVIYGKIAQAVSATQVTVSSTDVNAEFYPLFVDSLATSTGVTLYGDNSPTDLRYNPSLGRLTLNRARIVSTEASTSTSSGALIVDGGIGTASDIFVNGLRVGAGWKGKNNIVVRGVAEPQPDDNATGQGSIAIGYDTMQGIATSYANIAIGRLALSSGTGLVNSIAIGDRALMMIGVYQTELRSAITNISLTNPVVITSPFHNLTTGTLITIKDVNGTIELNDNQYYAKWLSTSTFSLYTDINVNDTLDGTGFTTYISSGSINVNTVDDNNIAIGTDAGMRMINGRENFFLGHKLAQNITTGSYNLFIGHNVANNMTKGSGNISIGGDNLVDGLNDQINIGSLLYYNGGGYTQLNSDTGLGLGTFATATYFLTTITNIEQSIPVKVYFTATYSISSGTQIIIQGVSGMTEVTTTSYYASYQTATSITLYYDYNLTNPVNGTGYNTYTGGGEILALEPYGALSVLGGAGITGNLIVGNDLDVYGNVTFRKNTFTSVNVANTVLTTRQSSNAAYYPTFVDSNNISPVAESLYTTSSFVINPTSRFVGIDTESPTEKLHVNGRAYATVFSEASTSTTISSNILTLNLSTASVFTVALNSNITSITINNVAAAGKTSSLVLILIADGTARAINWPFNFNWPGGTPPTLTSTNGKTDIITAFTVDGGSSWYSFITGQNL